MSSSIPVPQGRVAVLVDGENISHDFAKEIMQQANQLGTPLVRRVYGNGGTIPGWKEKPGFKFVDSGCGKNSADMMLVVEAMELAFTNRCDRFVIVTSDGDFTHLAFALVERGLPVLGIGEFKAPEAYKAACTEFVRVGPENVAPKSVPKLDRTTKLVIETIKRFGEERGMTIADLNSVMCHKHGVLISNLPEKKWYTYLTGKSQLFAIGANGPEVRVRLTETAQKTLKVEAVEE